jgi:hypothetical protein
VFRVLAAILLAVAAALAVFTLMLPVDLRYAAGAAALFLGMGSGASAVLAWGFRLIDTRPMAVACIAGAVMVAIGLLASPRQRLICGMLSVSRRWWRYWPSASERPAAISAIGQEADEALLRTSLIRAANSTSILRLPSAPARVALG